MHRLPTGYRWVGWFLIVLGAFGLQWCVLFPPFTVPKNAGEFLSLAGFVLSPSITLLAGILLLSSKPERHRLAIGVLVGGTIVSSVYACVVYSQMESSMTGEPGDVIAIALIPLVIVPTAVAAVTMMITAAMLLFRCTPEEIAGEEKVAP